ncbi:hypothetical protein FORC36_4591 (plasmid) [Vibrio vulnificus]|uniref:hypothetical protein n=1 Tax=Vibrio vulnificus TaxID=672 RepID=UPI000A20A563|nr:hypothetical protein [Vibrio vulnificus]ARN69108.1 hypothetical protein FORC36_4591 [Vibrio vulnificus]
MKEFSYYLRQSALNSLKLLPTVGKKLTDSELNKIQELIEKEEPSLSVKRQGSGLLITSSNFRLRDGDLSEMVSDCVPKKLTKKELKDAENQEKRKKIAQEKNERIEDTIGSNEKAAKWVEDTFGLANMNNYNKAALIDYITGKEKEFKGMLNRLAGEIAYKIGAVKDNMYDYSVIKHKFESETSN